MFWLGLAYFVSVLGVGLILTAAGLSNSHGVTPEDAKKMWHQIFFLSILWPLVLVVGFLVYGATHGKEKG